MKIMISICQICDAYSMEYLEKILSFSLGVENVSGCSSCRKANTKITFVIDIKIS